MKKREYDGYPEIHKKSPQICENYQITRVIDNLDEDVNDCPKNADFSLILEKEGRISNENN